MVNTDFLDTTRYGIFLTISQMTKEVCHLFVVILDEYISSRFQLGCIFGCGCIKGCVHFSSCVHDKTAELQDDTLKVMPSYPNTTQD